MFDLFAILVTAVPLDVLLSVPGQAPVFPNQGNGFAAKVVGGVVALAVIMLGMIWLTRKPKRRR